MQAAVHIFTEKKTLLVFAMLQSGNGMIERRLHYSMSTGRTTIPRIICMFFWHQGNAKMVYDAIKAFKGSVLVDS